MKHNYGTKTMANYGTKLVPSLPVVVGAFLAAAKYEMTILVSFCVHNRDVPLRSYRQKAVRELGCFDGVSCDLNIA